MAPRRRVPASGTIVSDAIFQAHQHFGRGADEGQVIAEIQQEHIGRWIGGAQGAVDLQGAGFGLAAEALRQHNLKGVAIADIFFGDAHAIFVDTLFHVRFGIGAFAIHRQIVGLMEHGRGQGIDDSVYALDRPLVGAVRIVASIVRVRQDNQLVHGVVEYHQRIGQHECHRRHAQVVAGGCGQIFEIADDIIGHIAHGATNQTGQPLERYRIDRLEVSFDDVQRVLPFGDGELGRLAIALEADDIILDA